MFQRKERQSTVGNTIRYSLFAILVAVAPANAQSGGDYVITKGAIAGGGGTASGGDYVMSGTIGQHDADEPLMGGDYELSGGFWSGVDPGELPPTVGDDTCAGGSNDGGSCSTGADCPGGACGLKNRYITATPIAAPGIDRTVQVCIASMPLFPSLVGECWWAGAEQPIQSTLRGAPLQCTLHAAEWVAEPLHLFGAAIIPDSTYEVRMCSDTGLNCSDPLVVGTGKWGDVVAPFGGSSQPNINDLQAVVSRFQGVATAPNVTRTDLVGAGNPGNPNMPNVLVNISDVQAAVDAFRGIAYPYIVTACP